MENKKTLLVLENDAQLSSSHHSYTCRFMDEYKNDNINCEVILFTRLQSKTQEEIFIAVNSCTDIVVQTCFINGSDSQFFDMLKLLSKIKDSKNISIHLMGYDLKKWFIDECSDEQIYSIKHHNIYDFLFNYKDTTDGRILETNLLDFSLEIGRYQEILDIKEAKNKIETDYKLSAKDRPTGKKVKILRCLGFGKVFENLPIGEVVDVLDMSLLDPNKNRGVWVWGNGEPIKLVVDNGFNEYQPIIEEGISNKDLLKNISSICSIDISNLDLHLYNEFSSIIDDKEYSTIDKANEICELFNIEKRGNRANIKNMLISIK